MFSVLRDEVLVEEGRCSVRIVGQTLQVTGDRVEAGVSRHAVEVGAEAHPLPGRVPAVVRELPLGALQARRRHGSDRASRRPAAPAHRAAGLSGRARCIR